MDDGHCSARTSTSTATSPVRARTGRAWSAAASSWLRGGERGAGEWVFLFYPLTQRQAVQPLVWAEPGAIVTSVHGGFQMNFISCVSCSRCSHLEIWCIIFVLVSGRHASCAWVLHVEY